MLGYPQDLLQLELNPLATKKVGILSIQGDKLVVDWNNFEKASQKKLKTFKTCNAIQAAVVQQVQTTVSVDVQKRM